MNDQTTLPPHSVEAETAVLGSVLIDSTALDRVAPIVKVEDYYRARHQVLYRAMLRLRERDEPVDVISLVDELTRHEELEQVGGLAAVLDLSTGAVTAVHAETYARVVAETAAARRLIQASGQIAALGYNRSVPVAEALTKASELLSAVSVMTLGPGPQRVGEHAKAYLDQLAERANRPDHQLGVPSGLADLDRLTGGWQEADLILLAARPSLGKTSLALHCALHAAKAGHPVLLFSLEMSADQVMQRLLAHEAVLDSSRFRTARLEGSEWDAVVDAARRLDGLPLHLDDTPALPIVELRARVQRAKREHGLALVIVDYLQLLTGADARTTRVQEVGLYSRALKVLARETKVPVLALSQLSRQAEQRADGRPQLSDLRDSGQLEQDADLVLFLHREEEGSTDGRTLVDLTLSKHRNGSTGALQAWLMTQTQRWYGVDAQ